METNLDHIHILIECSPQHFIGENNKKNKKSLIKIKI